jgi:ATP-dependent DNA helicase RecG
LGGLPVPEVVADFQTGRAVSRRYRNRRIGEFLKELDLKMTLPQKPRSSKQRYRLTARRRHWLQLHPAGDRA